MVMSSTESSIPEDLTVLKIKENKMLHPQDFIHSSSNTICSNNANITLEISYSYSHKTSRYIINTKIIDFTKVSLNDLVEGLSDYIPVYSYSISYSDTKNGVYFFCGQYPFDNHLILCELSLTHTLWLKLRPNVNNNKLRLQFDLYEEEMEENFEKNDYDNAKTNYFINIYSSRANERSIRDIIRKVHLWSQLHKGVIDNNGLLIKLTYQQAADDIGISKKTLSNYYEHLKLGKYFGFDFNKNKNNKVNILNRFIKNKVKSLNTSTIKRVKSKRNKMKNKIEDIMPFIVDGLTIIDDAFTFEDASE